MLGPIAVNRESEFTDELPKTRSAKIMQRPFQTRELGLKEENLVIHMMFKKNIQRKGGELCKQVSFGYSFSF
jgi:hypothetical protein